jgi:putative hemolysin
MPHIVDVLIEERARELMRRPLVWRLVKKLLYPLLGYDQTIHTIDTVQNMGGHEIFRYLSDTLDMKIDCEGLQHVPRSGCAVITPNHPAGIADGVAVYEALKNIRQDITFFANRDAIRAAPKLSDLVIPVEWVEEKRTRERNKETVKHMIRAFRNQRLIVIFPSGRLARPTIRGLVERVWTPTAVNLAQKYDCPIVPMHIHGRNSWLYYFLYFVNTELKDMTLFRELLHKKGQRYRIRLAAPFRPEGDSHALTLALREFVTAELPRGGERFSRPDMETPDLRCRPRSC